MVEWAPIWISFSRRFQTFAVSHFVFCFLGMGPTSLLLTAYIFFSSSYWPLFVAYAAFYLLDWSTPAHGGRRWEWFRRCALWRNMCNYFPVSLHKSADLEPTRNYIFGVHPHGVLCVGSFTNFCTDGTGFSQLFPGFKSHLTMLPLWFRLPFFRDYLMTVGLIPSSKKSIQHIINDPRGGNVCCIIPGGAPESLLARPGDVVICLKKRLGFLKLAITNGTPLVPVFSFGDHELWEQTPNPAGSALRRFQDKSMKIMQVAFPMLFARGIFQYTYGLMPYRRSVNTVVGEPIDVVKYANPSLDQILELQSEYIAGLTRIFEQHRAKYLRKDCRLIIT